MVPGKVPVPSNGQNLTYNVYTMYNEQYAGCPLGIVYRLVIKNLSIKIFYVPVLREMAIELCFPYSLDSLLLDLNTLGM